MSDFNCENLIPPFVDYLTKGEQVDSIQQAVKKRKEIGGSIFTKWYVHNAPRVRLICELDDLFDNKTPVTGVFVVGQEVMDEISEFDRIYRLGLEQDLANKARVVAEEAERQEAARLEAEAGLHPIEDLGLSTKVLGALTGAFNRKRFVEDLVGMSKDSILGMANIGGKAYDEIREKLIEKGYPDGLS